MKIPIFYGLKTGLIVSWIRPADEKESDLISLKPPDGQGVLVISEKEYGNLFVLQDLVTKVTGLTPVYERYAVVDEVTGDVVQATYVTEDTVMPGYQFVKHEEAGPGWKLENGVFVDYNPPIIPVDKG